MISRETRIGVLAGLGFMAVFSVLTVTVGVVRHEVAAERADCRRPPETRPAEPDHGVAECETTTER